MRSMSDNLAELFAQARERGLVDLSTLDGGTYSCTILLALECREMKAKSGFLHRTPQAAVGAAILVADEILRKAATPPARCTAQSYAA
jgi:hypothetical protein